MSATAFVVVQAVGHAMSPAAAITGSPFAAPSCLEVGRGAVWLLVGAALVVARRPEPPAVVFAPLPHATTTSEIATTTTRALPPARLTERTVQGAYAEPRALGDPGPVGTPCCTLPQRGSHRVRLRARHRVQRARLARRPQSRGPRPVRTRPGPGCHRRTCRGRELRRRLAVPGPLSDQAPDAVRARRRGRGS